MNFFYFFKYSRVLILTLCILMVHINIYSQTEIYIKQVAFNNDKQRSVKIPFETANSLVIIPMIINDSDTLHFILDSGLNTTLLTELAKNEEIRFNYAKEIELKGLGTGTPLNAIISYGNEFKIDEITGQNQDIYILLNENFDISSELGKQVNGIIGYSIFSSFIVEIDYRDRYVYFHNPEYYNYKKKRLRAVEVPLIIHDTKPYIEISVTLDNGEKIPVKLLLDTGNSHAIWLDAQNNKNIKLPGKNMNTKLGTGLNGEVTGHLARIKKVSIGQYTFHHVLGSFPDSLSIKHAIGLDERQGSIGAEIIRRFNVIIDYPNEKITFIPNAHMKDEFAFDMSGLEIVAPEVSPLMKYYEVKSVRKGSPADNAGIKEGDILYSINNDLAYDLELGEIIAILRKKPGYKIRMIVSRNGEKIRTIFRLKEFI